MGHFDHLKKTNNVKKAKSYSKVVLVGLGWETLALFGFFSKVFGKDQVLIIDRKEWSEDQLFYPGPCVDRGEASGQVLKSFVPGLSLKKGQGPLFYKDRKFRSFQGRARPHELKEGESYFKLSPNFFDLKSLFDEGTHEKMEEAQKSFLKAGIMRIEFEEPTDIIEQVNFKLTLFNHHKIECQYLFYGHSPREFLELVDDKKRLSKKFIEFSSQFEKDFSLVVTFDFDSEVLDPCPTLFIPQSQTHDMGHFIVEVENILGTHRQRLKACCRMPSDQIGPEDAAKKLQLLKRTLRRIFPNFRRAAFREKIYLLDYFPFNSVNDDIVKDKGLPYFSYFGRMAPIEKEFLRENRIEVDSKDIFNNARSLLSVKTIQHSFGTL